MITRYIVGDITETELKYIAHGVNCQNVMGAGVARALYEKFPNVKERYHGFCDSVDIIERLGKGCSAYDEKHDKIIFNLFTQFNYGRDEKRYVNYGAIAKCFESLVSYRKIDKLSIPKIGCGLAGGDWKFVEQLINDTVGDNLEIWVYTLPEKT